MNEMEDIGVKVGESNINNIRYADDSVLICSHKFKTAETD